MGDGPATGGPLTMSAASAWFWNPNIWLPPNVTWESFQEEASAENESNINRKPLRVKSRLNGNGYWFLNNSREHPCSVNLIFTKQLRDIWMKCRFAFDPEEVSL